MAYFPNGSAAEYLDNQCCQCILPEDAACPILLVQLSFNYEQLDSEGKPNKVAEVMNALINEKGDCQMKPLLDENVDTERLQLQIFDLETKLDQEKKK